jgi:hypothetical protein
MAVDDEKQHSTEAQEWYFRLMNDPEYFEKWRYIDTINDYSNLIAEFQKLYDKTLAKDRFARARILSGIKQPKRLKLTLFALVYYLNKNLITTIITYRHMSSSILLEREEQEQLESGIPVCGANLSSPVVDQAKYIAEIHYKIGNKLYIENAD